MQNTKIVKLKAFFAAVLLTLTVFSVSYSVMEHNHECTGDNCSTCFILQMAEQNLKLLKLSSILFAAPAFYSFGKTYATLIVKKQTIYSETLISRKIRIND